MSKMAYGENGYLDFDKLWKLLEKKNLKQQYLINNGIHRNTVYKLKNNDNITSEVICNLCKLLNCQPKDILEYIPNQKKSECIKQEQNNGEQVQNEPQSTESAEKVSNDKTIEQLKSVESVADKQSNSISLEETQKILNAKREECKNVQYIEPKKEERKPVNNIDDALTEQLHAIKERREKAKNNDSDECPF